MIKGKEMERVLTDRQLDVYKYIYDHLLENKYSPSFRDIATEFDVSIGTVQNALKQLKAKGWIDYSPSIARSIYIADDYFIWWEKHNGA